MRRGVWSALCLGAGLLRAGEAPGVVDRVTPLFNGQNLEGFHTWLVDTRREDPRGVFSVTNGMIRVSGEGLGYLGTLQSYQDYHLIVEFKWGTRNWTWGDRVGKARDSGVFLHSTGPDGNSVDGQGAFKAAIECNLFQGATGDLLLIRGHDRDGRLIAPRIRAEVAEELDPDGHFTWKPGGQVQTREHWGRLNWFGKDPDWKDVLNFRGPRDPEHAYGAWNRLECFCEKDRIRIVLNGVVVNEAFDVRPSSGPILLQCEGSEIYFRRVELHPLEISSTKPAAEKSGGASGVNRDCGPP